MNRVMLVRHAEPDIDIALPAADWALTARGVASTQRLAIELARFRPPRVIASPERKALETARILAGALDIPIELDDRFAEQGADAGQFLADYAEFRALVRRHFDRPEEVVLRGESAHAAGERFASGVRSSLETMAPADLPVIVSHGRIIASWLASLTGSSAWDIWTELRLPDLLDVDIDGKTFRSVEIPLA